jgi:undecaprenyl-diphosphatase
MMFGSLIFIGIGFLITGTLLVVAQKIGSNELTTNEMKFRSATFVGICQGFAIWPGISRSGTTIFGSLFCGLTRESAVKFVFLMSIPAIMGATILDVAAGVDGMSWAVLLGMAISAVTGIVAIKTMIRAISKNKLFGFSIYTWALGVFVIGYALFVT